MKLLAVPDLGVHESCVVVVIHILQQDATMEPVVSVRETLREGFLLHCGITRCEWKCCCVAIGVCLGVSVLRRSIIFVNIGIFVLWYMEGIHRC